MIKKIKNMVEYVATCLLLSITIIVLIISFMVVV